jgi:hypothetical protein
MDRQFLASMVRNVFIGRSDADHRAPPDSSRTRSELEEGPATIG